MIAVILAAGMGSRLMPYNDLPKTLTLLANEKSILQMLVENISVHIPKENILVVVGYREEMIRQCFPDLKMVTSQKYASQNTAKSLFLALEGIDDDVLWVNGDVVFNSHVLNRLLELNKTAMVVNSQNVGEEEVKYRLGPKGTLVEVSKQVKNPTGEAVGINLFKKADIPILKKALNDCQESDYFERGIEYAIERGVEVWPCLVGEEDCIEIDFMQDLERANRLLFGNRE